MRDLSDTSTRPPDTRPADPLSRTIRDALRRLPRGSAAGRWLQALRRGQRVGGPEASRDERRGGGGQGGNR